MQAQRKNCTLSEVEVLSSNSTAVPKAKISEFPPLPTLDILLLFIYLCLYLLLYLYYYNIYYMDIFIIIIYAKQPLINYFFP